VRDPEEALAAARRAAAAQPPVDTDEAPWHLEVSAASARRLAEWAIIEPEQAEVYSIRRFGRPITALKRLLIRLMSQYLGQMSAQQSRFNANIAAHVIRLEERVAELEQAAREREDPSEPPPR
jgi:hypothetical protein